jgi:hypothetical protein
MKKTTTLAVAAILALGTLPFTTNAFSLDEALKIWADYMRAKVAALEEENAALKAQLASCETTDSVPQQVSIGFDDDDWEIGITSARISWETNVPSSGWVVLRNNNDEKTYASPKEHHLSHAVEITGLSSDTTYEARIVAESEDGINRAEKSEWFETQESVFQAYYIGEDSDGDCYQYRIVDSEDNPLQATRVVLDSLGMFGPQTDTTSETGKAEYCAQGMAKQIVNAETGEVYYPVQAKETPVSGAYSGRY